MTQNFLHGGCLVDNRGFDFSMKFEVYTEGVKSVPYGMDAKPHVEKFRIRYINRTVRIIFCP